MTVLFRAVKAPRDIQVELDNAQAQGTGREPEQQHHWKPWSGHNHPKCVQGTGSGLGENSDGGRRKECWGQRGEAAWEEKPENSPLSKV